MEMLEALPGPASEMKLHVIKARPGTLQEAVAHATEVDAVIEAEFRKTQGEGEICAWWSPLVKSCNRR